MNISRFIKHHYRHYNAASVVEAAEGYAAHLEKGGKMFVTLAGAMSTAELGLSLAEMIRRDKVHGISCTGANLEEDIFNLVAHDHYERIPNWRNLTKEQEKDLERRGRNRVTDTCIPEGEAFRAIEHQILELWQRADTSGQRFFPHEYFYQLIREGLIKDSYQIDPKDSWLVAACEKNLPIFVPGWEDSTLGNIFVSHVIEKDIKNYGIVRSGPEYMGALASWYVRTTMGREIHEIPPVEGDDSEESVHMRAIPGSQAKTTIGFFQIGGGIAGDFPICVVPMIHQDLRRPCPYWGYFCQISDSTTSYGGYSGAIPSEKITWGKLDVHTPMYVIESDATIVAPLIFAYQLGW
ncbi:MAG: deoxyhypusine synthase family protein [Phycisphaeraceae bacterium]|nr:MAG: deoxyhypusine synthase family protein [Phycisphaeraceae bacterium]